MSEKLTFVSYARTDKALFDAELMPFPSDLSLNQHDELQK